MKIFKKFDKPLLILVVLLFIFGLIMIFSSSNVTAFMKNSASPYRYFLKQCIFLGVSVFICFFLIHFHSKNYIYFSRILMVVITFLLAILLIYGTITNHAKSWFHIASITIQPSEFAKVITIVYLASFYDKYKDKLNNPFYVFRPLLIPILIAGLIFIQPDLGTMLIYVSIVAFIFFIIPSSKSIKKKIGLGVLVFISLIVMIFSFGGESLLKSRQLQRFDYFNPCSEEKFYSTGNQVCNGYIAFNNGGFFGRGLGNSIQKYLYLPEAHTDFIFPIIVEEIGVIGAFAIFILYFLLLGRIIKIGKESYNDRGAIICYGISFYIFIHIFVNLGGVMGIIPMTGVPLPFFSYGGSFAMCLVLSVMLVERVNIENKLHAELLQSKKKNKK